MIINLYWIKNFYFFLPKRCVDVVQECSIEAEIKILSMLYSSRSIRLQVFCTIAIRKCIRLQWYVAVIARCRVQYGKYFLIFCSLFTSLYASEWNNSKIWKKENICQYCTRQCTITTLSLNACLDQMEQNIQEWTK